MKKFIIGIISYGKDKDRITRATKLFEQLKDFPKLIIAQGYKPEKTHANDIIIYEPEALGIGGARIRLQEEFLKLNIDYIIFMDDDNVIEQIDKDAPFTDYNGQGHFQMYNLECSRKAVEFLKDKVNLSVTPNEDVRYCMALRHYFKNTYKPLFKVKHSIENSTWRLEQYNEVQ